MYWKRSLIFAFVRKAYVSTWLFRGRFLKSAAAAKRRACLCAHRVTQNITNTVIICYVPSPVKCQSSAAGEDEFILLTFPLVSFDLVASSAFSEVSQCCESSLRTMCPWFGPD